MRIVQARAFTLGLLLAASFLLVLGLIFSPLFGEGQNGLEYADDVFNRLSKGSSWFIPRVSGAAKSLAGRSFSLALELEHEASAGTAATLLIRSRMGAERRGKVVVAQGDLGLLLARVLEDAEAGYRNDGARLAERYGMDGRQALAGWWHTLKKLAKGLSASNRQAEADMLVQVMKKAIEPAHNYWGIPAGDAGQLAWVVAGLLVFYVLYTIWWGSAIYFLFEGLGLSMGK